MGIFLFFFFAFFKKDSNQVCRKTCLAPRTATRNLGRKSKDGCFVYYFMFRFRFCANKYSLTPSNLFSPFDGTTRAARSAFRFRKWEKWRERRFGLEPSITGKSPQSKLNSDSNPGGIKYIFSYRAMLLIQSTLLTSTLCGMERFRSCAFFTSKCTAIPTSVILFLLFILYLPCWTCSPYSSDGILITLFSCCWY